MIGDEYPPGCTVFAGCQLRYLVASVSVSRAGQLREPEKKTRSLCLPSVRGRTVRQRQLGTPRQHQDGELQSQIVAVFQSGELGAGPEACREEGQDAGALCGGGEGAPGRDRPLDARRPARPGADRRPGVQLRVGERDSINAYFRLLHVGEAVLLPVAREGRAIQRGAGAPFGPGIRGRVS